MELYNTTTQEMSRILMRRYSTSFSSSTFLFPKNIRIHICNIYSLVRIADEIVDSYGGPDSRRLLDDLERETLEAIKRRYSPNPIVHAFALTAANCALDTRTITAFFQSMRLDSAPQDYTDQLYKQYIHGSAEVIGLMCLSVFCGGDRELYAKLKSGAEHLGSAYQKVNFLRDLRADHDELGRLYFPGVSYDDFDEQAKQAIIRDIERDFAQALPTIADLPRDIQPAIQVSYRYYSTLLAKLARTSVDDIKRGRIRLPNFQKSLIFAKVMLGRIT